MKEVRTSFFQIAFVIVASMTVPYAGAATLAAAGFCALFSIESALKTITLVVLIKTLNPVLVAGLTGQVNALGWLVLCLAGIRILTATIGRGQRPGRLELYLLIFVSVVSCVSFFKSEFLSISLFKLISFAFSVLAVFSAYRYLLIRKKNMISWFVGLWLAVLGLSLPLFAFPEISYFRDGMGFQGVLNQPQAMAIFCVPAAAWATSVVVFRGGKAGLVTWVIFTLSWVMLFLTRGRIGFISIGISGVLVLFWAILGHQRWRSIFSQSVVLKRGIFFLSLLLVYVSIFPDKIFKAVFEFVHKGQMDRSLSDSFEMSRGFLIAESMENFRQNIWAGIGFGVSRSSKFLFQPVIEPITGLPIGASTEKANLIVALLEEVGVIGTAAFLPFLFCLVWEVKRHASFGLAWAFFAMLTVNIGEMVFFSMGGLGLYSILLVGLAVFTRYEYGQPYSMR